jgi:hypothetical protein
VITLHAERPRVESAHPDSTSSQARPSRLPHHLKRAIDVVERYLGDHGVTWTDARRLAAECGVELRQWQKIVRALATPELGYWTRIPLARGRHPNRPIIVAHRRLNPDRAVHDSGFCRECVRDSVWAMMTKQRWVLPNRDQCPHSNARSSRTPVRQELRSSRTPVREVRGSQPLLSFELEDSGERREREKTTTTRERVRKPGPSSSSSSSSPIQEGEDPKIADLVRRTAHLLDCRGGVRPADPGRRVGVAVEVFGIAEVLHVVALAERRPSPKTGRLPVEAWSWVIATLHNRRAEGTALDRSVLPVPRSAPPRPAPQPVQLQPVQLQPVLAAARAAAPPAGRPPEPSPVDVATIRATIAEAKADDVANAQATHDRERTARAAARLPGRPACGGLSAAPAAPPPPAPRPGPQPARTGCRAGGPKSLQDSLVALLARLDVESIAAPPENSPEGDCGDSEGIVGRPRPPPDGPAGA